MKRKTEDKLLNNFVTVRFRGEDFRRLWGVACRDDRSVASLCRKAILAELPVREEEISRKEVVKAEEQTHNTNSGS